MAKRSLQQFSFEVGLQSRAKEIGNKIMKPTRVQAAIKILNASAEEIKIVDKPKAKKAVKSATIKKAAKKPNR